MFCNDDDGSAHHLWVDCPAFRRHRERLSMEKWSMATLNTELAYFYAAAIVKKAEDLGYYEKPLGRKIKLNGGKERKEPTMITNDS